MKTEGLLKIIIVLLVLFFCPMFVLGIFASLLGLYGIIMVAVLCASGLIWGLYKLSVTPLLCKKVGFIGIAIYLVFTILPLINFIPYFGTMHLLVLFSSTLLLLLYQYDGSPFSAWNGWGAATVIFIILGFVMQVFSALFFSADYARELGSVLIVNIFALLLTIGGFLVLLFVKPKASPMKGNGVKITDISKAERRNIVIIAVGVMLNMLLRVIMPFSYGNDSIMGIMRLLGNIPLIVIAVGFVLQIMNNSSVLKES